jgi:WD40 repeat protein
MKRVWLVCLGLVAASPLAAQEVKVRTTCKGHTDWIESLAFSPDGKTLASASRDATIKLWDVATGRNTATLKGHSDAVSSVAFSPDGKTLASGSWDKAIKLWDVATGRNAATFSGHAEDVDSVAFNPAGKTLASLSWKTIELWDVASGKNTITFDGDFYRAESVAFSPDGKTLASGSDEGRVRLWEVTTGKIAATFVDAESPVVCSVAFSPDGKTLASVGYCGGRLKLWNVTTGKDTTLDPDLIGGHCVAFSPDGKAVAFGRSGTVELWDVASRKRTAELDGGAHCIAFSPDGKTLASGGADTMIKLWDVKPGREAKKCTTGDRLQARQKGKRRTPALTRRDIGSGQNVFAKSVRRASRFPLRV